MRRLVGLGLGLVALSGCTKVPNPFYVDELGDEASDTAGEVDTTGESESGSTDDESSSSESESESDTSESESDSTDDQSTLDDDSSEDTDCPPSESGCPCLEGTMCFPGLTCVDGFCFAPEDCALENAAVQVQWNYASQSAVDTSCNVTPMVQDSTLTLAIDGCADGVTSLSVVLAPLPPGFPALADTSAGVRVHFEQDTTFIRVASNPYDLWLVDGGLLVSGNAAVSDYPGEVLAALGQCPPQPKFCGRDVGELQRRGVRVLGSPFYDGNSGLVDPSMAAWVDVAVVDCQVADYRFAIFDWP